MRRRTGGRRIVAHIHDVESVAVIPTSPAPLRLSAVAVGDSI